MANEIFIPAEYLQHVDSLNAQFREIGLGWTLDANNLTRIIDLRTEYNLPPEAIIDPVEFFIYMKYRMRKGAPVKFKCPGRDYVGDIRVDIQMFLVSPEHYACAIAKEDGCCDYKKPNAVICANTSDIRRWTNRGGR